MQMRKRENWEKVYGILKYDENLASLSVAEETNIGLLDSAKSEWQMRLSKRIKKA